MKNVNSAFISIGSMLAFGFILLVTPYGVFGQTDETAPADDSGDDVVVLPTYTVTAEPVQDDITIIIDMGTNAVENGSGGSGGSASTSAPTATLDGLPWNTGPLPCPQLKQMAQLMDQANQYHKNGTIPTGVGSIQPIPGQNVIGLQNLGVTPDELTQAGAFVFYNTENKSYTIAFSGTELVGDGVVDIINNFQQNTATYTAAMTLTRDIANTVGASNVVVIGHSLGGSLAASASAAAGNLTTYTVDAAGASPNVVLNFNPNAPNTNGYLSPANIYNYNVDGQMLDLMQQMGQVWPTLGMPLSLSDINSQDTPLAKHYLSTFIASLPCS